MPVSNPRNRRQSKTAQANPCDGCGRVLPKGSIVTIWTVWRDGFKHRLRFCSDCQGVIYGCESRRSIDFHPDTQGYICREICECCDSFPLCEKVEYQRGSEPGELFFGDLPIDGTER